MQLIHLVAYLCYCSTVLSLNVVQYSNRWSVQIEGGKEEADRLAQKHGFVNEGKIIDNYYSFQDKKAERVSRVPTTGVQERLSSEPNVNLVEQQVMKSYKLLGQSTSKSGFIPTDSLWHKMWYIHRDDGPTYNVIEVWKKNITGQGVVVAVVDEGLDPDHPEIKDNYDSKASWDFHENDASPLSSDKSKPQHGHGAKCAGVIAAVSNNEGCGVGLAHKAQIGGIRLFFDDMATDAQEARALSFRTDYIDIYSNSWGPDENGFEVDGPEKYTQIALKDGTEKGRNGRGSIYVFAAGNGGNYVKDSCAYNGYVNSIYTIAITGINGNGLIPSYGEHCAGIMAVTFSTSFSQSSTYPVVTAGLNGTCVSTFGGSSAATAMASGLIALTLSANPKLSWRDVQHIIVRSARPAAVKGVRKGAWTENKAGLKVNDYVGFGLMDASKMVSLAANWSTVPEKLNCTIEHIGVNKPIPSIEALEDWVDLTNMKDACNGVVINYLEHVEVKVHLNYSRRGDLEIMITSPSKTVSNLTHYRLSDSHFKFKELENWVLMTLHLWGETAKGKWKLALKNSQTQRAHKGILFDWTLILHGTTLNPLDANSNVFSPVIPHPTGQPTTTKPPTTGKLPTSKEPTSKVAITAVVIGVVVTVPLVSISLTCYCGCKTNSKLCPGHHAECHPVNTQQAAPV